MPAPHYTFRNETHFFTVRQETLNFDQISAPLGSCVWYLAGQKVCNAFAKAFVCVLMKVALSFSLMVCGCEKDVLPFCARAFRLCAQFTLEAVKCFAYFCGVWQERGVAGQHQRLSVYSSVVAVAVCRLTIKWQRNNRIQQQEECESAAARWQLKFLFATRVTRGVCAIWETDRRQKSQQQQQQQQSIVKSRQSSATLVVQLTERQLDGAVGQSERLQKQ